jgi:hypothetical protein
VRGQLGYLELVGTFRTCERKTCMEYLELVGTFRTCERTTYMEYLEIVGTSITREGQLEYLKRAKGQ